VSGWQEILLILVILGVILMLPRRGGRSARGPAVARPRRRLTGPWRLAVLLSLLWPAATAVWLQPWGAPDALVRFVWLGAAPVAAAWALGWVIAGFRRPRS
jgi:hypothetical protein